MEGTIQTKDPNVFDIATHKELWTHMLEISRVFIASGALPKYLANGQQVMVILEMGQEMGFKFMESVKYLYIVNGSISLTGQGAARRLKEAGYRVEYEEVENKCTATVYKNRIPGTESTIPSDQLKVATETVTFEDAQKSKYTGTWDATKKTYVLKPGWYEGMNRRLKLRYLALSTIVKTHLPEVLGAAADIKEVAEDYPVIEEVKAEQPKVEKGDVNSFVNQARNKNKKVKTEENPIVEVNDSTDETKPVENAEVVEAPVEVNSQPVTPALAEARAKYFAKAKELGKDNELAVKEAEEFFGNKKTFDELSAIELSSRTRTLTVELMQKRIEENKKKEEELLDNPVKLI